jgi:hypothetical protein
MTIYRCVASGVFLSGETWSFRQHFDSTAAIATIAGDWFAQLHSAWTNGTFGLQTLYPVGTEMTLSSVAALSGVPFREGLKQVTPMTDAGTNTNGSKPEQTCILVSLRSALVGKNQRGRIHLPAPAENTATGGELGVTEGTRVSTAIGALYAGMRLAGHTPVIYNVKVSVHDPVVQVTKVIVTEEVDRVLRTLRGRTKSRRAVYT